MKFKRKVLTEKYNLVNVYYEQSTNNVIYIDKLGCEFNWTELVLERMKSRHGSDHFFEITSEIRYIIKEINNRKIYKA